MDWITDRIAIGNYRDAQDKKLLHDNGIRSILSLDGTVDENQIDELELEEIACIRMNDGPDNEDRIFLTAVQTLFEMAETSPPVLVQCHAGRSRSVVVVAGYLMRSLGLKPDQAIARIAQKREICITSGLERHLIKLVQDPRLQP